jgi:hypothetical protein
MGWNSQDIMFEGSCTLLTVSYHVPDTDACEKIHFSNRLLEGEFDIFFGFLRRNLNGNLE